jgi:membrane dipeptidase
MTISIISRREALTAAAKATALLATAPFINLSRYQLFPWSGTEYSARAIKLVRESIVIDMLGLLSLGPKGDQWMRNPDSFTEDDLKEFRDSGITVFHTASGTGGPNGS